jgi:hypothetical protein
MEFSKKEDSNNQEWARKSSKSKKLLENKDINELQLIPKYELC